MSLFHHYIALHSSARFSDFEPVANMEQAIELVESRHIRSEIIGDWLWCFTNYLVGFQLIRAGFWRSAKHNAYIFTENRPDKDTTVATLRQIREIYGCRPVAGGC